MASFLLVALLAFAPASDSLLIQLVGNAGVSISDGTTTLLLDLPYTSGAHGYQHYDLGTVVPVGHAVSVITHRHTDHWTTGLFEGLAWDVIGPEEITRTVPSERVLPLDDTIRVGAFSIEPQATDHANVEHYSYLIRWQGRKLYAVGDTEDPTALLAQRDLDVVFITPWLACIAQEAGGTIDADRQVLYHLAPSGRDRICNDVERLAQGTVFGLTAAAN